MKFADVVRQYIEAEPGNARRLARHLGAPLPTIMRWAIGAARPHATFVPYVLRFIAGNPNADAIAHRMEIA